MKKMPCRVQERKVAGPLLPMLWNSILTQVFSGISARLKHCIRKASARARQVVVLEDTGFITRSPSPNDKRVMQLYPTEKTMEVLPQIRQVNRFWQEYLTEDLTQQELEILETLLRRIQARAAAWTEEK